MTTTVQSFRVGGKPVPYPEIYGDNRLRAAISKYLERLGIDANRWDVIVTNGGTQALSTSFTMLSYLHYRNGDVLRVMAVSPTWLSVPYNQVAFAHGTLIESPMMFDGTNWSIDIGKLTAKVSEENVNCVFVVNPSNPTGYVLQSEELNALLSANKAIGAVTILDVTYDAMTYHTRHAHLAVANAHADTTFIVGSLSKTFAIPGERVGFVLTPKDMGEMVAEVVKSQTLGVNVRAQAFAADALEQWEAHDAEWFDEVRVGLMRRSSIVVRALRDAGLQLASPQGAYYVFARLPASYPKTAQEFCEELSSEYGVDIVPGNDFGMFPRFVRISFANTATEEELQVALDCISNALK